MPSHMRAELVLDALEMANGLRRPGTGLVAHSDRGSQYTSLTYTDRLDELKIDPSVGSKGDAYDNAMAESFFATVECERIDRRTYRSQAEARLDLFQYIEGWYNPHRRHSALRNQSPMTYERLMSEAA